MMRSLFLILTLALAACTNTPEPIAPVIDTDTIAGYWSGKAAGKLDTGKEVLPIEIGVLIIADCAIDNVCGKFAEDGQCPGDIILLKIEGNRYFFIAETLSGTTHRCGIGNSIVIELELRSEGTMYFVNHNGATLTGILQRK